MFKRRSNRLLFGLSAASSVEAIKLLNNLSSKSKSSALNVNVTDILDTGVDIEQVKSEYKVNDAEGRVLKDGFSYVECVTDQMYYEADKHGENKMEYNPNTPVSIVRYADVAGVGENAAAGGMTQKKCFEFCKKLGHMKFFGLVNGGDAGTGGCYCTPHYVQTGGKSEGCNVPCSGDSSTTCGGTTKSAIFEMHDCEEPPPFSTAEMANFTNIGGDLKTSYDDTVACYESLLHFGQKLADVGGKTGNKVVMQHQQEIIASNTMMSDLVKSMQSPGVVYQGTAGKLSAALTHAIGEYNGYAGGTNQDKIQKARASVVTLSDESAAALKEMKRLEEKCIIYASSAEDGSEYGKRNDTELYTEVADQANMCEGTPIMPIMVAYTSVEDCAERCRATVAPESCVGFQMYQEEGSDKPGLQLIEAAKHFGLEHLVNNHDHEVTTRRKFFIFDAIRRAIEEAQRRAREAKERARRAAEEAARRLREEAEAHKRRIEAAAREAAAKAAAIKAAAEEKARKIAAAIAAKKKAIEEAALKKAQEFVSGAHHTVEDILERLRGSPPGSPARQLLENKLKDAQEKERIAEEKRKKEEELRIQKEKEAAEAKKREEEAAALKKKAEEEAKKAEEEKKKKEAEDKKKHEEAMKAEAEKREAEKKAKEEEQKLIAAQQKLENAEREERAKRGHPKMCMLFSKITGLTSHGKAGCTDKISSSCFVEKKNDFLLTKLGEEKQVIDHCFSS